LETDDASLEKELDLSLKRIKRLDKPKKKCPKEQRINSFFNQENFRTIAREFHSPQPTLSPSFSFPLNWLLLSLFWFKGLYGR